MSLTDKQKRVKQLLDDGENPTSIARAMGVSRSTVRTHIKSIEAKGEASYLSPAVQPDHMKLVKTTVQYGAEGQVLNEWKRLTPEIQALEEIVEGLCEKVRGKGKAPPRKSKTKTDGEDILFELDLYDSHIGLYATKEETLDADYNCEIACDRMIGLVKGLCARANKPKKGLLVFGGDILHGDSFSNSTAKSGNTLDIDSRYNRVVHFAKRTCREAVRLVAEVCEELEVIVIPGNHSECSEIWLAAILDAYYENCPNITVRIDPSPHKATVWGDNLIVLAHGDQIAANKWALVIAAKFAALWGKTKFRYLHLGHVHHQKMIAPVVVDEQAGLVVEYLPAITSTDAWHAGAGFVGSQKGATAFEYDKSRGMITRFFQPA